ncbi:MAG: hypothetical protein K8L91_28840 [Anaerolineae bacterium]|nr:hypothetical protein [Anaerolineae bacterium]
MGDSAMLCADYSRQANSQLFGTASQVGVWLLLEYTRPWGKNATDENELPAEVQTWLQSQCGGASNGRVQFIRRGNEPIRADGYTFFVAVSSDMGNSRLYRLHIPNYEALLAVDVAGMVVGKGELDDLLQSEPIYLVCTNGKRDISCAKYGRALFDSLDRTVGGQVWQTTHIGGHRFAGTAVILPSGLTYGYLFAEDAGSLVEATRQKRIWLEKLRGRALYAEPIQAAEYFLRQFTGRLDDAVYHFVRSEAVPSDEWRVTFEGQGGQSLVVHFMRRPSSTPIYKSTGDAALTTPPEYHLVSVNGAE